MMDDIAAVVPLSEVIPSAQRLLEGKLSGRVVVDVQGANASEAAWGP